MEAVGDVAGAFAESVVTVGPERDGFDGAEVAGWGGVGFEADVNCGADEAGGGCLGGEEDGEAEEGGGSVCGIETVGAALEEYLC